MRKIYTIILIAFLSVLTVLVSGCDLSEERVQSDSARANALADYSEVNFVEPLTRGTAMLLIRDVYDAVDLKVVFPSGEEEEVAFKLNTKTSGSISNPDTLVPVSEEEVSKLKEKGWVQNAEIQLKWRMEASIFPLLEQKYGITLSQTEKDALKVPAAIPSSLSRYGTTDLVVPQNDGTFYNGPVTLIWDDTTSEFKLIYNQGNEFVVELPIV